jgi:integrase
VLSLRELEISFRIFREHPEQFTRENYLACALLVALGVRKGELIAAKWEEFDFDENLWSLPVSRSKTGTAISIPLAPAVVDWLRELHLRACGSEYVFPSRRTSKRRAYISDDTLNHAVAKMHGLKVRLGKPPVNALGRAGVEHFTIHDLRRTCRSLLAELGVPSHIAERCLNHELKGGRGCV